MNKAIVKLYFRLVKSGKRTLDSIEDEEIRKAVEEMIEAEKAAEEAEDNEENESDTEENDVED